MKEYEPKLPGKIMHYGKYELVISNDIDRLYLKDKSKFYKIYFDGDGESNGGFELIRESLNFFDIDESTFALTMSFVNKDYDTSVPLYKDQIFLIWKEDNKFCITTAF